MRTKNLSRLLCAIDGTIYNDRTNIFKKFILKTIKRYKVKKTINDIINQELNLDLILEIIYFLNKYNYETYEVDDHLSITFKVYDVKNDNFSIIIENKNLKQKLELHTSTGDIDIVYKTNIIEYMTQLSNVKHILKSEIRDFFISSVVELIDILTERQPIGKTYYTSKIY